MWNFIIKYILLPIFLFLFYFVLFMSVYTIYLSSKGLKRKGKSPFVKKIGFLKRVFYLFPKRLTIDLINRNPQEFNEHGLHLFCGEQGSGKSIALVEMLLRWKQRYPELKIYTNMSYKNEDGVLMHWRDILEKNNDIYGTCIVIDEIQSWFSSLESKDFPPEMLTEISQQRKQRKAIIGTAQVFSRVSKPIREQCTYVYMPMTLFGCLTIVRKTKAIFWDNEKQRFKKYCGTYFFVQTDIIRNAFDTFKKIERYSKKGFSRPTWIDNINSSATLQQK